jgi:hypothetical protein
MSISSSFIKRIKTTMYVDKYKEWRQQYDLKIFDDMLNSYIVPLLKNYGYVLNNSKTAKRIEAYLWAHVWTQKYDPEKEVRYPYIEHNGCEDDYHWFLEIIDTQTWNIIFDKLEQNGIFDGSAAGQMQRNDFPLFIWKQIDLENSKSYIKTSTMREYYRDEDYDSDKLEE